MGKRPKLITSISLLSVLCWMAQRSLFNLSLVGELLVFVRIWLSGHSMHIKKNF